MTAGRVLVWLGVAAAAVLLVFGAVRGFEGWQAGLRAAGDQAGYGRCRGEWADANVKQANATVEAIDKARTDERTMAAAAAQGERDARQRAEADAKRQAAAAARASAAAGGLSGDLAALDRAAVAAGIPDAASCPGEFAAQRDAAIRARAVFGACVTEYRVLAEGADRERAALELRLDTSMSWIRATGAPGSQL